MTEAPLATLASTRNPKPETGNPFSTPHGFNNGVGATTVGIFAFAHASYEPS